MSKPMMHISYEMKHGAGCHDSGSLTLKNMSVLDLAMLLTMAQGREPYERLQCLVLPGEKPRKAFAVNYIGMPMAKTIFQLIESGKFDEAR